MTRRMETTRSLGTPPGIRRSVTLRAEQWAHADRIAAKKGITVDDVIDLMLEAGFAKIESLSDLPENERGKK